MTKTTTTTTMMNLGDENEDCRRKYSKKAIVKYLWKYLRSLQAREEGKD